MDLPLSAKAESLIQKQLASGKFATPEQVVEEALLQLDQQAADWAEIDAKLEVGLADLRAGRYREIGSADDIQSLKREVFQRANLRRQQES